MVYLCACGLFVIVRITNNISGIVDVNTKIWYRKESDLWA
jgi:hypothetical protein